MDRFEIARKLEPPKPAMPPGRGKLMAKAVEMAKDNDLGFQYEFHMSQQLIDAFKADMHHELSQHILQTQREIERYQQQEQRRIQRANTAPVWNQSMEPMDGYWTSG